MRGPALPAGFPVTARRAVRGGSWNNNQTNARAAYRNFNAPDNRNNNIGFRLACPSHTLVPLQRRGVTPVASAPTGTAGAGGASGIGRRLRFAARGEGSKMARVSPVRTGGRSTVRRAHTKARRFLGVRPETPQLFFIHPPSSRPNSTTSALTCWYCPSVSQRQ